jgi:hypothetical protein
MATKENKMHAKRKNLLSIGHSDSGEQCGPWTSCFTIPAVPVHSSKKVQSH